MNDTFRSSEAFQRLRKKAEQVLEEKGPDERAADWVDIVRLVHELEIYGLELELQNEELRRAKAEMEASEERYFDLWNTSPVAYVILNSAQAILFYNKAAQALLGGLQKKLPGNSFLLWLHTGDTEVFHSFMKELHAKRKAGPVEVRLRHEGGPIWVQMSGVCQLNDQSELEWRLALVDIAKRKRAELALRRSKESLRLAVGGARLGTWNWNLVTDKIEWNRQLYSLLGRDPDGPSITAQTFFEYIHPQDVNRVREHVANRMEAGSDFESEFRVIRGDGEVRWLVASGKVYRDSKGRPVCMAGVNYDITGRRQAEEALRVNQDRLQLALAAGDMGTWERNMETGEAIWDRRQSAIYGRDPEEAAPNLERFYAYIEKDDLHWVQQHVEAALQEGKPFRGEFRIVREDGERRWLASFGVPIRGATDAYDRIVGINVDITERKLMELDLAGAKESLEKRVQERTRDLQRRQQELSAEIETRRKIEADLKAEGEKLAAAYQQREFLSRKLVDLLEEERREMGSALHDEVGQILTGASLHLEALIRDRSGEDHELAGRLKSIHELVRNAIKSARAISSNLRSDTLERFGLVPALKELINEMREHFGDGIHFFVKNVPEPWGDRNKELIVYRVVQESLHNVLKHAESREVFVNVNGRDQYILLSVEDSGVGFDYAALSEYREKGQAGSGLTIMRERVAQAGGIFHVESRPGRGTQVIAEIPV